MNALEWDERYRSADHLWSVTPNLFVADRLGTASPGRGLDLGAGEGRNSIWLASLGWEMTAVDFSEVAVARGAAHSDGVDFIVADLMDWEPEGVFDLVLVAYLHLLPTDFEKLLSRARHWLSPGGELFLIGHDMSNIENGCGGPQVPGVLWDVADVVGWLSGMSIIESEVVSRPVETEHASHYARDALIRARALPMPG